MMRIDSVSAQPDRVGRYKITFENGQCLRLYRQTIETFGIYSGKELDETEYKHLSKAAGEMSAKMRAVRIISASSVSKSDLERRLIQKGETAVNAGKAVEWLTEMDVLDDRKTAEDIVSRCISKGYGINRAKQALYEKRIPKEYWDAVLEDYPDQTEQIVKFLRSRLGTDWGDKELRRTMDALVRRGYNYSEIRQGLHILSLNEDFLEETYE